MLVALNKPFNVLCQFSPHEGKRTLADVLAVPNIYPAGRLDFDSEGLLLLTDDGVLQQHISHPKTKLAKTYWAQVEGIPDAAALAHLQAGVRLSDFTTAPASARLIDEPASLWERQPPIRVRQNIPTRWLELCISEGKNRQVRRMTAAVGHPTLRLIRAAIGNIDLPSLNLAPGRWVQLQEGILAPSPGSLSLPRSELHGAHQPSQRARKKQHV